MYFVILRGVMGKEVFLTSRDDMLKIVDNFNDPKKSLQFYAINPNDLQDETFTIRKREAVYGLEVKPENTPKHVLET